MITVNNGPIMVNRCDEDYCVRTFDPECPCDCTCHEPYDPDLDDGECDRANGYYNCKCDCGTEFVAVSSGHRNEMQNCRTYYKPGNTIKYAGHGGEVLGVNHAGPFLEIICPKCKQTNKE